MYFFLLPTLALLSTISHVSAGFNPGSKSNMVIYWGQNSANQAWSQRRLSYYCDNADIDIIILSFLISFNDPSGDPILNFANEKSAFLSGTTSIHFPELASDIPTCQSRGKTILLSLGGATYNEGGFASAPDAITAATKLWAKFGPDTQGRANTLRPFGRAVVDGFDLDFESPVSNMAIFGTHLRALMDAGAGARYRGQPFYLSAAPQCVFPEPYNEDILNNVPLDFVNVQFYNNPCGASAYAPGSPAFNFAAWDAWARRRGTRVLLGVPASASAAGSGYLPPGRMGPVLQFASGFETFGGVMMWDASQAWANPGFVEGVKGLLRG